MKKKSGLTISEIKRQLYVSQLLQHWMVCQYHNNPAQRHPRISKMVELLSQNYYFPGMRKEVKYYIDKYQDCQLNKHLIYTSYRYIQYTKITNYLWQNIIIDFIVKFPKSKNIITDIKYDSILIVVNKFTKYAHLIPYNEKYMTKQRAWIILDRVIQHHRIPESITSDKDKIFISNFWQTLIVEIGTKIKLLTIYYSQTDKQIE